jgi:hypothetical protein
MNTKSSKIGMSSRLKNTFNVRLSQSFLSLVEEVLGSESSDKVPMEKVVMLLWQFRDDPSVITFMARFISKVRRQDRC